MGGLRRREARYLNPKLQTLNRKLNAAMHDMHMHKCTVHCVERAGAVCTDHMHHPKPKVPNPKPKKKKTHNPKQLHRTSNSSLHAHASSPQKGGVNHQPLHQPLLVHQPGLTSSPPKGTTALGPSSPATRSSGAPPNAWPQEHFDPLYLQFKVRDARCICVRMPGAREVMALIEWCCCHAVAQLRGPSLKVSLGRCGVCVA